MMEATTVPDLLRYDNLSAQGIARHGLDRLIEAGEFARITPGLFLRSGLADNTTAASIGIAAKKPCATLCLLTALSLHGLTDENPVRSNTAIPRGTQPVTVHHAPIAWHCFDADTFDIGRTKHLLPGGASIGLYSTEREQPDWCQSVRRSSRDVLPSQFSRILHPFGPSISTAGSMNGSDDRFTQVRPLRGSYVIPCGGR